MKKILFKSYFLLRNTGVAKKEIIIILISSIVTVFFEILGIGIFIPIIDILLNDIKKIELYMFSIDISNLSKGTLYTYLIFFVIFIIGIKSIIWVLHSYLISKFWRSVNEKITLKVYENILYMDYNEFTKESNSSHSNLVVLEVEKVTELISSLITYLVEIVILFTLFIILFIYDFSSSIITFCLLFLSISVIYFFFRRRIISWGEKRQIFQDKLQNDVKGGLMSYMSVLINGGLEYFVNNLESSLSNRNIYIARQKIYSSIPRSFIEFSGLIIIITTGIALYYFFELPVKEILSYIIILIISFSRILPSFNRLLNSYNQINFYKATLDFIESKIKPKIKNKKKGIYNFKESIIFKNVGYSYSNNKVIFDSISFDFKKGDILGIFGKSGSGKSTLIKIIMGIIKKSKGEIFFDGINFDLIKKSSFKNLFGYVEQNVRIFNANFFENITFVKSNSKYDKNWYEKVIKLCQLEKINKTIAFNKIIEDGLNLSGGQIQRIGLARALFKKPQILVLDEFTSSLDDENKKLIIKSLNIIKSEMKISIIIISHDQSFRSFCNKIIDL